MTPVVLNRVLAIRYCSKTKNARGMGPGIAPALNIASNITSTSASALSSTLAGGEWPIKSLPPIYSNEVPESDIKGPAQAVDRSLSIANINRDF